ncbi:hypothetical protein SISSUDRAFT_1068150 [Sistotremastrum suecicum HHB10207 ss-3]|nr:hypothetical protein SISSUDRAFT_1068150 [Sistotremastrum suecicum HHB10207 ss-3]
MGALWVMGNGDFTLMYRWLERFVDALWIYASDPADLSSTEQRGPFDPPHHESCCIIAMFNSLDSPLPDIIREGAFLREMLGKMAEDAVWVPFVFDDNDVLQLPHSEMLERGENCLRMLILNAYLMATSKSFRIFLTREGESKAYYLTKLRDLIMTPAVLARIASGLALHDWFGSTSAQLRPSNEKSSQALMSAIGWFDRFFDESRPQMLHFIQLMIPCAIETLQEHGYHESQGSREA